MRWLKLPFLFYILGTKVHFVKYSKWVTVVDALVVNLPRLGLTLTLISAGSKRIVNNSTRAWNQNTLSHQLLSVVDRSHYSWTYKCLIKTFLLCRLHRFLADFFIRGMSFTLYNNARVSHKISFMDSFCNYWLEVSCWTMGRLFICVSRTQQ